MRYTVLVENIGIVVDTNNIDQATREYDEYVGICSQYPKSGRVGRYVIMMDRGRIIHEYHVVDAQIRQMFLDIENMIIDTSKTLLGDDFIYDERPKRIRQLANRITNNETTKELIDYLNEELN